MIPSEKAVDLIAKFGSKELALKCVKEIIKACDEIYDSDLVYFEETLEGEFWKKVKEELR